MTTRHLDAQMRTVLLRLEMLSHGATQAWNPSGGHSGEPDDRVVTMVLRHDEPPHLKWKRIYRVTLGADAKEQVVKDAAKELEEWCKRPAAPAGSKSFVEIMIEDGDGYEPQIVAQRYGVDIAYVRRQRARAGRDTETGRKLAPVDESSDRPAKARELRRRGMSTRQIAFILSVSQSAVMNWTRRQA